MRLPDALAGASHFIFLAGFAVGDLLDLGEPSDDAQPVRHRLSIPTPRTSPPRTFPKYAYAPSAYIRTNKNK